MCFPTGVPELPLLSTTDVSLTQPGWTCTPLTVESVLELGVRFTYELARVLRWLEL